MKWRIVVQPSGTVTAEPVNDGSVCLGDFEADDPHEAIRKGVDFLPYVRGARGLASLDVRIPEPRLIAHGRP